MDGSGRADAGAPADPGPLPRRTVPVQVTTLRPQGWQRRTDSLAGEEPMEIRVAGPGQEPQTVGVTMRTPGNDFELAVGFLLSEGVLAGQDVVRAVRYCTVTAPRSPSERYNTVTVEVGGPVDLDGQRRLFTITSACGICGRAALDRIEAAAPALSGSEPWPVELLMGLPDALAHGQTLFATTGGLHGAGLFDRSGRPVAVREDVGRHNAVDKLVGWAGLNHRLPLADLALAVSGRLGFEIVQKAALAGVSHVVAVSAPSSLAVDLARRMGMTVVAFVRDGRANVYCGEGGVVFPG